LWFWLYGVTQDRLKVFGPDDGAEPPNSAERSIPYKFFFAKVRANGGIRFYYAVVWLLSSAVTAEAMLSFNDVQSLLGGKHDSGLQLPSQLLHFRIGMFSFFRLYYQLPREFINKREATWRPSTTKRPTATTRSRNISLSSRRARSSLGPSFLVSKGPA
jgi:hypothetical protein